MSGLWKRIFRLGELVLWQLLKPLFLLFPIDGRKVVMDNFNGRGYGCNPKYIAEALRGSDVKVIWLGDSGSFPDHVTPVRYGSISALYHLATARVRVSNVRNSKRIGKRKGQLYIQTWHGMIGLKSVEAEAEAYLDARYVSQAKKDGSICDLMIANNDFDKQRYEESFWYNGPVLKCGLPRLRPVLGMNCQNRKALRRAMGLSEDKYIALFAPTFRDYDRTFIPDVDYLAIKKTVFEVFGVDCEIAIRLHPNTLLDGRLLTKDVDIDLSAWPDSQEVLGVCDMLITDYSSVSFDFMLTGKPVFMLMPDLETYRSSSRPLAVNIEEIPFPIARSSSELIYEMKQFDRASYTIATSTFCKRFGVEDSGEGDIHVAKWILERLC